jgi:two-component system, chemotaxis family, sensor kinase CheA
MEIMSQTTTNKYRPFIIAIGLFIAIIVGVLALNVYIASQLAQDGVSINVAGRQRMLSQRMTKTLLLLGQTDNAQVDKAAIKDELAGAVKLFDTTLRGFRVGGAITGGDGKPASLNAVATKEARDSVEQAAEIWRELKEKFDLVTAATSASAIAPEVLTDAGASASAKNLDILKLMNNLTTNLEQQSKKRVDFLRLVQVLAILLALLVFGYIVFSLLRNLQKSEAAAVRAKKETDDILATVNEGLFLLDSDFRVGSQQSKFLNELFAHPLEPGKNFLDVLRSMVPEKTVETVQGYLKLLFGDRVKEKLIAEVNPLKQVEVNIEKSDGSFEQRYLSFQFKRVGAEGGVPAVLVAAADISKQVALARELELARAKNEEQMGLLMKMMNVEGGELATFLEKTGAGLDAMNEQLAGGGQSKTEAVRKLAALSRSAHTIKGDAAALGMEPVEQWAHRFENTINYLRQRENLTGNDLLALTVQLREMFSQLDQVKELTARLSVVRSSLSDAGGGQKVSGWKNWGNVSAIAKTVAVRMGKHVQVKILGDDKFQLADAQRHELSDILIQLVRNAVAHGIEGTQQRAEQGKPDVGTITVEFKQSETGQLQIVVQDDGAGLDFTAIRDRAVASGLLTAQAAATAGPAQLVGLIFTAGFSTANEITQDAGRGVGMDIVNSTVNRMGGKIGIASKPGSYTRFTITLPNVDVATGLNV